MAKPSDWMVLFGFRKVMGMSQTNVNSHTARGPLLGIKVIEMAGLGPCPLAGQLLADLGAEVIVVDRKAGQDLSRDVNRRGKRSIVLDLKSSEGVKVVHKLIRCSDVIIEGFRPGVMERMGLGPEACEAMNERLVFGRMTGWGQKGPLSHSAGHDINYLSLTGALHAMGEKGRPPVPPLNLVADYGGGTMFLVMGVLAALVERSVSGKGQVVDAAMVDGVPAMMGLIHTMMAGGMWTADRADNLLDGAAPFYRTYETRDGKYVSVGPLEPQFFAEFVEKAGLPNAFLSRQMDKEYWPEMTEIIASRIAEKTRDEWATVFDGTDACVAPVLDWNEAPKHHHMADRGTLIEHGGIMQAAPAPRFSRSTCEPGAMAGKTGEDTQAVIAGLDGD